MLTQWYNCGSQMQYFVKFIATKIPVISFILSFVLAWLLVPIKWSFPMIPFFILFTCLSSLIYLIRKDKNWIDLVLYLGILVLSCFLIIRANEVIILINFIFIFLFGSLLIIPPSNGHALTNLLLTPFFMIAEALKGKNIFPYSWNFLKKYNNANLFRKNILSILVTILFLGITIPLLSSANPFFNQLTQDILHFLNLEGLARYFRMDQIMMNVVRLGILLFLCLVIPRVLTASAHGVKINEAGLSLPINYLIPKVAMSLVLIIFFITQAQLYFATPEVLQSMGYTNSRITNEVFFQVTIVAFIIFFLSYLDSMRKGGN